MNGVSNLYIEKEEMRDFWTLENIMTIEEYMKDQKPITEKTKIAEMTEKEKNKNQRMIQEVRKLIEVAVEDGEEQKIVEILRHKLKKMKILPLPEEKEESLFLSAKEKVETYYNEHVSFELIQANFNTNQMTYAEYFIKCRGENIGYESLTVNEKEMYQLKKVQDIQELVLERMEQIMKLVEEVEIGAKKLDPSAEIELVGYSNDELEDKPRLYIKVTVDGRELEEAFYIGGKRKEVVEMVQNMFIKKINGKLHISYDPEEEKEVYTIDGVDIRNLLKEGNILNIELLSEGKERF